MYKIIYIYRKAHFQQIIQKATIQILNINLHKAFIYNFSTS